MKKYTMIVIALLLVVVLVFAACKTEEAPVVEEPAVEEPVEEVTDEVEEATDEMMYADGVYFARDEIGARWTYFVTVTVDGGKIVDSYWGGTNFVPQGDKRVLSENQAYGMVAWGGAASYWYEQAEAAEAWLLENQDPAAFAEFYTDEEGHTDALTTDGGAMVSVHVVEFFDLVAAALASDPVPAGEFGETVVVTAEGELSENGWVELAEFIVVNGTIVAIDFDALYGFDYVAEGDDANANNFSVADDGSATAQSKDQLMDAYGMVAYGGSELEWYEQAALLEAYVLENQSVFGVTEDGYADGVAGVSVHVNGFEALFNAAFGQ